MSTQLLSYLHSLKAYYEMIPTEEKPEFRDRIQRGLLASFQLDLSEKTSRMLEIPGIGPLPLNEYSMRLVPEIVQTYVNGLFYSTIVLCGIAAERLCFDILNANNNYDQICGVVKYIYFNNIVNILKENSLVKENTVKNLYKLNDLRNKYVHLKTVVNYGELNPVEDSKKAIELLFTLMKEEIGPGRDTIWTVEKGTLVKNKSRVI